MTEPERIAAGPRKHLSRRTLRAMRSRWQRDLERLEQTYFRERDWNRSDPESETIRNLATAIVEIDGLIARAILERQADHG